MPAQVPGQAAPNAVSFGTNPTVSVFSTRVPCVLGCRYACGMLKLARPIRMLFKRAVRGEQSHADAPAVRCPWTEDPFDASAEQAIARRAIA